MLRRPGCTVEVLVLDLRANVDGSGLGGRTTALCSLPYFQVVQQLRFLPRMRRIAVCVPYGDPFLMSTIQQVPRPVSGYAQSRHSKRQGGIVLYRIAGGRGARGGRRGGGGGRGGW